MFIEGYMSKRYFWLKLKEDFFEQDEVKVVESMPNGKDYIIFYLKLILKSINSGGELRFKDAIPYNEDMLSTITNTNIDVVRSAVKLFEQLGMIEVWSDGTLFMTELSNMIGSESSSAHRVRKHRERKMIENKELDIEALQCNGSVTKSNTDIDTDKDIDTDIDLNKEIKLAPAVAVSEKSTAKKSGYSEKFEQWWSIYPRKTGKGAAWNRWKRDKLDSKVDQLIEKLEQQNALQYAFTETQYIPNASTYLNQKRYDDEVEFKGKKSAQVQATTLGEHNQSIVDQYFARRGN